MHITPVPGAHSANCPLYTVRGPHRTKKTVHICVSASCKKDWINMGQRGRIWCGEKEW